MKIKKTTIYLNLIAIDYPKWTFLMIDRAVNQGKLHLLKRPNIFYFRANGSSLLNVISSMVFEK